jgi:glutathione peroxidase-family protein
MNTVEAGKKLLEFVSKVQVRNLTDDPVFEQLRQDTLTLLDHYARDPFNMVLIDRAGRIIEEFESISFQHSSPSNYERAKIAGAVISSRIRRTHYTAY